jgi:sulfur-oxidizing protein SoxA
MTRWRRLLTAATILASAPAAMSAEPGGADPSIRSASRFLSQELAAEQRDDTLNRGMLWVEEGRRLWHEAEPGSRRSCAGCHGDPARLSGVAARYPSIDAKSGALVNLEGRINLCRERHQQASALPYESEPLLALTALVALQSRGQPVAVDTTGPAAAHLEAGRRLFETRQGQLDLACRQCHEGHVGQKLRGDTISSGIATGYPAYRLEWQGFGSLHRRLRACQIGVRAAEMPAGSPDHLALELYLAWRARNHPLEAPAIRR